MTRAEYERRKAAVIARGGFSAFEATASPSSAAFFDRLERDKGVVITRAAFPFTRVKAAERGGA